jgi:hypothetical protein
LHQLLEPNRQRGILSMSFCPNADSKQRKQIQLK